MCKFQYLILASFLSVLAACSGNGRVVDGNGVVYSEYFQCLIYAHDGDFSFDVLKTLGKERMPDGYVFSDFERRYLNSPDTIEEVYEVYIRNHTSNEIHVTLLETIEGGSGVRVFESEPYAIKANGWVVSEKIVSVTSIYGPDELNCSIKFEFDGNIETVTGKLIRLRVDELSR